MKRPQISALIAVPLAALALTFSAGAPAASAATSTPAKVSEASVGASLTGANLTRWKTLTGPQKAETVRVLNDPAYGVPSQAAGLVKKYPDLKVTNTATDVAAPTLAASGLSRTSWVRQNWTILGVTYTEVTTTMGYMTSGSTVTSVNRCYGTYVNYVPLRTINSNSWYTLGYGLADCWTEWTLARPLQSTVTGDQGLRVNGYGQILKIWYV